MTAMEILNKMVSQGVTCFLATTEDGRPRVRPMATSLVEEGSLFFASGKSSDKMRQIAANPEVECCYMNKDWTHVRARGRAELLDNPAVKSAVWEAVPQLSQYFESADSPEFGLIRVELTEVLSMAVEEREYRSLAM
ncbi:MAG: pyridoxamine 5'-phosphate oxidase family protein [Phycisphaerae bacterium]